MLNFCRWSIIFLFGTVVVDSNVSVALVAVVQTLF